MRAHLETLASEQEKLRTTTARLEAAEAQPGTLQQQQAALTAELAEARQGQAELRNSRSALEEELNAKRVLIEQHQARRQRLERQIQELAERRAGLEFELKAKQTPGGAGAPVWDGSWLRPKPGSGRNWPRALWRPNRPGNGLPKWSEPGSRSAASWKRPRDGKPIFTAGFID